MRPRILFEESHKYIVMRPICKVCNRNQAAANYWRDGVRHYRSMCESCLRKIRKVKPPKPKWLSGGYVKKGVCDLCRFKAKHASQITVYHVDGNLNNCELINLRSICLNCVEIVKRRHTTWRPGDLQPDP